MMQLIGSRDDGCKTFRYTGGVYVWLGRSARTGRGTAQMLKLTRTQKLGLSEP